MLASLANIVNIKNTLDKREQEQPRLLTSGVFKRLVRMQRRRLPFTQAILQTSLILYAGYASV